MLNCPLGHREDLSEEQKRKASPKVQRYGCYTQWARLLRVRVSVKRQFRKSFELTFSRSILSFPAVIVTWCWQDEKATFAKVGYPPEVLRLTRSFFPGEIADQPSPAGVSSTRQSFIDTVTAFACDVLFCAESKLAVYTNFYPCSRAWNSKATAFFAFFFPMQSVRLTLKAFCDGLDTKQD